MHSVLALLISFSGLMGGAFVLIKFRHIPKDTVLQINFFAMALSLIYVGAAYLINYIGFIPVDTFPYVVRPGIFVLCLTPVLISWRMGL